MVDVVAVTGVTGDVGGKTLEKLHAAGVPVRGIVRRQEQADALTARGIDARVADLGDRATLARALEGVDQLFLITAATQQQAQHGANGVRAAHDAGVRAIVHLSGGDAVEDSPLPWARAIAQIDVLIRASGLDRTILHPSGFMTNLESSSGAFRRGVFPQTMGRGRIAWIDTEDIARVATKVLTDGVHEGAEPVLTGPDLLDGHGAAAALTIGLGRRIRYVHLPSHAFRALLRLSGLPAWQAEGLRQQFGRVARHGLDGVSAFTTDVERITGSPARSLAEWARSRRRVLLGQK
ncbi:Uncharacterized conserved protein YbjT, contains NAD(P)-binding and DUF2867 domains [Rathayibacter oskolensis]|uniref:Uncharacterized conserved protein YbjT, contains NAD(P)-binding and DUF2867 domains n=1 Tax=Rathayibacter oskolensis TaxID=1891671 RepID=A0A1X7N493_9MICO|nr:NAD(P)H-binding protein [Rathayibacter oskolensis]SMH32198.1 Uncharacterized conserved protein YbjT, contains NAD(P)-binding and DUF2867 domains [Rathayibacter oskolensis]